TNGLPDVFVVDRGAVNQQAGPVIDTLHSNVSGSILEFLNVSGAAALHTIHGSIAFSDANSSDRPSASVVHQSVVCQDGSQQILQLLPAQIAAVENAFLILPESGNTNVGAIDWGYTIADNSFNFLKSGQSVVLTSKVEVDDQHGGIAEQ